MGSYPNPDPTMPALEVEATEALPVAIVLPELTSIAHLPNRTSPISRVPEDVLALIFEADPYHYRQDVPIPTARKLEPLLVPFVVVISHVSRAWRNVAIRNPLLWTTIRFIFSKSRHYYNLYVERSKPCALDIRFECDVYEGHEIDLSAFHLHRCRKLSIWFGGFTVAFSLLRRLRTESAPRLESFKIDMRGSGDMEFGHDQFRAGDIFGRGAPILSSVKLYGISPLGCRPPLGALTHLKLHNCVSATQLSLGVFSEVLHIVASSLTHLSLEGFVIPPQEEDRLFDINLPALISLKIRFSEDVVEDEDSHDYIAILWECLNMPALETLSLYCLTDEELCACVEGLNRQRRTSPKVALKSLCLEGVKVKGSTADIILDLCPNIVEFSLINAAAKPVMEFILTNTKTVPYTGPLWPCLQRLTVSSCKNELLRAVVLARKAIGYPIVELCLSERLSADKIDWFRQHVQEVSTRRFP